MARIPFKKAAIPYAVRRGVAVRSGGVPGSTVKAACHYCGATGFIYWPSRQDGSPSGWVHFSDLELDHVVAEFKGGETSVSNIVLACRPCNRSKGHR